MVYPNSRSGRLKLQKLKRREKDEDRVGSVDDDAGLGVKTMMKPSGVPRVRLEAIIPSAAKAICPTSEYFIFNEGAFPFR